jgi:hypothetical protein
MSEPHVPAIVQMRRRVEALAEMELHAAARLLAWAIALHLDAEGDCYPGTKTLARLTGLDARTIRRVRPALTSAFDYKPGGSEQGGKRRSGRYHFRLDRGPDAPGRQPRPVKATGPDRGPDALGTGGAAPSEPGAVCPPKDHQGPIEGPSNNGSTPRKRTGLPGVIREMTEATAPPWPRRATL